MSKSKQQKIDLLRKIQNGEKSIFDLIEEDISPMSTMFFHLKRREPDIESELQQFKKEHPNQSTIWYALSTKKE